MGVCMRMSSISYGRSTVSHYRSWRILMEATDTPVPKPQRQGAIIILGMLAVAKREVVTEQVENLLKIGLGQHGMVSVPLRTGANVRTTWYLLDIHVSLYSVWGEVPRRSKVSLSLSPMLICRITCRQDHEATDGESNLSETARHH